jgi:hypothetical protein
LDECVCAGHASGPRDFAGMAPHLIADCQVQSTCDRARGRDREVWDAGISRRGDCLRLTGESTIRTRKEPCPKKKIIPVNFSARCADGAV